MAGQINDDYEVTTGSGNDRVLEALKSKLTEPLAVASGPKNQLFKALRGDDFMDQTL